MDALILDFILQKAQQLFVGDNKENVNGVLSHLRSKENNPVRICSISNLFKKDDIKTCHVEHFLGFMAMYIIPDIRQITYNNFTARGGNEKSNFVCQYFPNDGKIIMSFLRL